MKRWMNRIVVIAACLPLLGQAGGTGGTGGTGGAGAGVVELGQGRVTRYAVTDETQSGTPIVTGELVGIDADASAVRLAVAGQPTEMTMSLVQARSLHDLLGHMLTISSTQSPDAPTPTPTPAPAPTEDTAAPEPMRDAGPAKRSFPGMNLADVAYYSRAWVFTDLILQSDAWRDDGRGYIFKSGHAPPGQYICTWAGTGSVRFSGDAASNKTGPNSAAVTVSTGDAGINMQKVGDVTDVSLIRVEHEMRASPFQPEYLDRLKPFKVLRFMDWANTNNSSDSRWLSRTRKGITTQAGKDGVAIEYMVQLCNELGADPWFCMPHLADDDYIRRYAELVRDRLHPDATIYLEYSNEVWNSQFGQHDYMRTLAGGKDSFSDGFFAAWAERCRKTFEIWSEVFGEDASRRLVRVAAVQLQNPWVAKQLLPRLNGQFDAIAPSAYFGITRAQTKTLSAATTADGLLDLCEKNIRDDNRGWFQAHGDFAKQWSAKLGRPVRLIAYEAGQHLSANGDENVPYYDALIAAQSNPRMYDLYLMNMRAFEQAGGDLFVAFNDVGAPGRYGSWGHLEYQNQPTNDAPKYKALIDYETLDEYSTTGLAGDRRSP